MADTVNVVSNLLISLVTPLNLLFAVLSGYIFLLEMRKVH